MFLSSFYGKKKQDCQHPQAISVIIHTRVKEYIIKNQSTFSHAGDTFLKISMTPDRNFSYPCKIYLRYKSIHSVSAERGINDGGSFV
jgi:hypothetical protein